MTGSVPASDGDALFPAPAVAVGPTRPAGEWTRVHGTTKRCDVCAWEVADARGHAPPPPHREMATPRPGRRRPVLLPARPSRARHVMSRRPGPIRTCARCRRDRPHYARKMCKSCYSGQTRKHDGPIGNPGGRGVPRARDELASRVDDYALLRGDRSVSRADAARRSGISYRTALRYDQRLKDQA